MGHRLDRLTAEQKALIPGLRDEWLAHGLSTERADRARAEAGVRQAYREVGLAEPELLLWLESPLAGVIGAALINAGQVGDQVWGQVRNQVWAQVGNQVRSQVGDQVRNQVRDQVWDQVWAQVGNQVRSQVGDQVGDQVRDQVRDQVWDQVGASLWGQHDAAWLAWTEFWQRCDIIDTAHGLREVGRSAGWWWAFARAAILTERPVVLNRDEDGRLHCEDGPAIAYPDGFGVWAVHGVRVPAEVVESDPAVWKSLDVVNEANVEVRRVMIDRFGPERLVQELDAKRASDDFGTLHRICLSEDEDLVFAEVVNSTPEPDGTFKNYWLRVPPTMTTPRDAIAWTFDLDGTEYLPEVMT